MERKITLYSDEKDEGKRIDGFLKENIDQVSRAYIQKLITKGQVFIDGVKVNKKNFILSKGMHIEFILSQPQEIEAIAEDIPLKIVYEDNSLLVVDKPQNMVVHPAPGHNRGTLVNALMHRFENLSLINGVIRPGIVHRIDKDTSGLLMVAKTDEAHRHLALQLKEKTAMRVYVALVHGRFAKEKGTICAPLGRHPKNRLKRTVIEGGKPATTHYQIIKTYNKYSLVELHLETGRTHQIRVHMSHIGHPLLGDSLYGIKNEKIKHNGQLLHAQSLGFIHPKTGEYKEFYSELPSYFQAIIRKIEMAERTIK